MAFSKTRIYAAQSTAQPGTRVFFFFGLALAITAAISFLFADLLWRRGWTAGATILMALFVPLMFLNAVGAMHGIYGFALRRWGDRNRITNLKDFAAQDISSASTAILFPIYNEEARDVYARLDATYKSLENSGHIDGFDFHVLSDSTAPMRWVDEETRWLELMKNLGAFGRVFYRRRLWNEAKKSGNIRDFLNQFGNRYRYFIVFDADSFMPASTMVALVKLMEAHPHVGLIQTPPAPINAESLFGRMQQFAARLYAPLFTAGANYWTMGLGNYVGHNAIVRTHPFMRHCDLPHLPGKKPFGGQILSHDFVEAALLLKNHWQVWQAYDLEESYEETPQGLIEYAQRDRRWCQGNLQHVPLVFAPGLRGISRLHFLFGIFAFLGGPLWLLFMLAFNAQLFFHKQTGLSDITVRPLTPFLQIGVIPHALLIFGMSLILLLMPKLLALIDLARDRERAKSFGGMARASLSALLELLYSTLQAPILMLWHTEFVISALLGRSVNWGAQKRSADGTSWSDAIRQHGKHTLVGMLWGGLIWWIDPALMGWFIPVLLGMLLAVPISVFTSRRKAGERARKAGLFLTPEETKPSADIVRLRELVHEAAETHGSDPEEVLTNPYCNALHIELLARSHNTSEAMERLGKDRPPLGVLRQRVLKSGLKSLDEPEQLFLLSDLDSMRILYRENPNIAKRDSLVEAQNAHAAPSSVPVTANLVL